MDKGALIRFKLTVQYDGSGFHGWQYQPNQRTVQGDLEWALSRLANSPRTVLGSGRTDAGVHATGQVASVDMPAQWTVPELQRSLNAVLSRDIWIQAVEVAPPRFHARYDAVRRSYLYRVGTTPDARSPFQHSWCWALEETLDRDLLDQAARYVVGEHSFLAFAKSGQPQRGDRCTVMQSEWEAWELGQQFTITANRYLHHMVRYLVGTMVDVARGRRPLQDIPGLLAGEPALCTSPPAPPEGLFLARVEYPQRMRTPEPTTEAPTITEARSTESA